MTGTDPKEDELLRSVTLQNARAILTARERAERESAEAREALQQSHEFIRNILESITDGFFAFDREWRFTFINRRGLEILRPLYRSVENLLGLSHWEGFPDTVGTPLEENFRRAMRDRVTVAFESSYPPLESWFDFRAYPSPTGLSVCFQDITPRKRAEEELRRQHEWFAVTLASIGDAVITTNTEGHVTFLNRMAEELTGWKSKEARGQPLNSVFKIIHERTRRPAENPVAKVLREGTTVALANHTALIAKGGREISIEDSAAPIKDAQGKIAGVVMVFHDVTERRQAEKERTRLTSVLERSLNEIYIFDIETLRFQYVNQGALKNLGYSAAALREKTPLDIKPEFTEESFRDMVRPLLEGRQEKHLFYTVHRRADGSEYPVEVHLQAVTHDENQVFLAVILDITERKKVEEALRQSEKELRALANSIHQLAWMADPDGRIFWYNRRWYDYTGTTFQEMEGWGWRSVHDPEKLPVVLARWSESIRTGESFEMEFPLRGVDGGYRWFLTRAVPVQDEAGRVLRWFGTNTDIDELKRTREALKEETRVNARLYDSAQKEIAERGKVESDLREAQEKLNRHAEDLEHEVGERTAALRKTVGELEAFSYSISHDMRAPLRSMQSFALILAKDYAPRLDAEGREYLRRISSAANRMDRLIQDVLTFSKAGRGGLPLVPVEFKKLLQDILTSYPMFQPPASETSVEEPLPRVLGVQALLTQCISNLLGNAVKFVLPGVTPRVRVYARAVGNGDMVRIYFRDNGIGIAREDYERIFGIFERLGKDYEGTGIGLAIVRKSAEQMGGSVGLESEPGKGSTFWLELSRAKCISI